MTKKGFFEGLGLSLLLGITFSFYNSIIANIVSIAIGAFIAKSKKAGGAIGFLASPIILFAPASLPVMAIYLAGKMNLLFLVIMVARSAFNLYFTILWVISIIVGIIVGHYAMKRRRKSESSLIASKGTIEESKERSHKELGDVGEHL